MNPPLSIRIQPALLRPRNGVARRSSPRSEQLAVLEGDRCGAQSPGFAELERLLAEEGSVKENKSHVLAGLIDKRAELAGKIDQKQSLLVALLADLSAIDTAIRLFDPTVRLTEITMKAIPPRSGAARGLMTLPYLALRSTFCGRQTAH